MICFILVQCLIARGDMSKVQDSYIQLSKIQYIDVEDTTITILLQPGINCQTTEKASSLLRRIDKQCNKRK